VDFDTVILKKVQDHHLDLGGDRGAARFAFLE
jgi:hypothetical protein